VRLTYLLDKSETVLIASPRNDRRLVMQGK